MRIETTTSMELRRMIERPTDNKYWTDARRPEPRLWIRSAEVRGNVDRRMGTQQQQQLNGTDTGHND